MIYLPINLTLKMMTTSRIQTMTSSRHPAQPRTVQAGQAEDTRQPWPVSIPAASPKAALHAFTAEGRGSSLAPTGRHSFADYYDHEMPEERESEEHRQRSIATNEVWTLRWYHETATGRALLFYRKSHY